MLFGQLKYRLVKFLALPFFALALALTALPAAAQSDAPRIEEIQIEGTKRIDPGTVRAYSQLEQGDAITAANLNDALVRLYDTDLFEDVKLRSEGSVVIITVLENRVINRISIEGNKVLKDEPILEVLENNLGIRPRHVFTEKLALDGKAILTEAYRQNGRYAAVITPKIINLPDRRVDLVFEINEGPLVKISSIRFIGNEQFSDRTLANIITSRESKWFAFFSTNDKYDAERVEGDARAIEQFYLQNGYAEIEVVRATGELLPDRSGFAVTIQLREGRQYTISGVTVNSRIEGVDTAPLLEVSTLITGEVYDIRNLEETLSAMTARLGEFGYAFVDMTPDIDLDTDAATLSVAIDIAPTRKNFVEKININGNHTTLDSVIRRRFELVEGDSFNQIRLNNSVRNVIGLGFFKPGSVNAEVLQGSAPEQSVIEMNVEENRTGDVGFAVGYSTLDNASLRFYIRERNLRGTGNGIRASASLSGRSKQFRVGVTRPYLFDRNITGAFDIFSDNFDYEGVDVTRKGFETGLSFSAANDFYHGVGYQLSDNKTRVSSSKALSVRGDEGGVLVSEVSYSLARDRRDSSIDPRNGYYWRISESAAGLGGDATYAKTAIRGQYLKSFYFDTFVLGLDAEAGTIKAFGGDKVSLGNRFFLGGRKLRGFASAGIGPRDTGDNSPVGGNNYYSGSINLTSDFGISKDLAMRWTIFSDAGTVWGTDYPENVLEPDNKSLRSSAGVGILWDTRLGPMSFSWAKPIKKEDYDRTRVFQFTFGGRF